MKRSSLSPGELSVARGSTFAARGKGLKRSKIGAPGRQTCGVCGRAFEAKRSPLGWTIYCSRQCSGMAQRKRSTAVCVVCAAPFETGGALGSRITCGNAECVGEAKSRAAQARGASALEAARRCNAARLAELNADMPPEPLVCARPGCANLVSRQRQYCSRKCHYDDRRSLGRGRKQTQAYHRCAVCREVFAWNGRGKGACCSPACRRDLKIFPAPVEVVQTIVLRHSKEVWYAVPLGVCAEAGCSRPAHHRHHVVYAQHVAREQGDVWNPDNALALCVPSHAQAHQGRLNLADLRDENYRFAVDLLGASRAYEYLRRRYAGDDPRLDALLGAAFDPCP